MQWFLLNSFENFCLEYAHRLDVAFSVSEKQEHQKSYLMD
ncbi:hypothetical protein BAZSYMA_ACONTIG107870_0 [Bathymodiolus azoricus thioautotrophic gill symbiont]|uniref:Uncharacterized protein n=1 Tax=Bathymodiolus azoricus thioautotrophic gill symbiont TaxID=235205 RepID=A0A1H6JXP0_9GAMM|nr:hypothetical protein BAZSYMA_ACONTIG107870_0 [Bathymodiolus azoricus thioautotrophic gill symbiont]